MVALKRVVAVGLGNLGPGHALACGRITRDLTRLPGRDGVKNASEAVGVDAR